MVRLLLFLRGFGPRLRGLFWVGATGPGAVRYAEGLFARHYAAYQENAESKKTAKPMSDAPEIIIRSAEPTDAPALARLRYEFRAGRDPATETEADFLARCCAWMGSRLMPESHWRCWVVEEAGRLVGAIWLQIIEKIPNPGAEAETHGYVSNLYVEPSRRGAGLGSMLMGACLRFCEKKAVDAVILWPTPRSRRLYERHGFAVREDLLERRLGPIHSQ